MSPTCTPASARGALLRRTRHQNDGRRMDHPEGIRFTARVWFWPLNLSAAISPELLMSPAVRRNYPEFGPIRELRGLSDPFAVARLTLARHLRYERNVVALSNACVCCCTEARGIPGACGRGAFRAPKA